MVSTSGALVVERSGKNGMTFESGIDGQGSDALRPTTNSLEFLIKNSNLFE